MFKEVLLLTTDVPHAQLNMLMDISYVQVAEETAVALT